jgi:hypothetical protein
VNRSGSRAALERLVSSSEIEHVIAVQRSALAEQRSIKLPRLVTDGEARADVALTIDSGGRVSPLRYLEGDERLRTPLEGVKGLKTAPIQPDTQVLTFVRQGIVSCSASGGCVLVMYRPSDAPAVDTPAKNAR